MKLILEVRTTPPFYTVVFTNASWIRQIDQRMIDTAKELKRLRSKMEDDGEFRDQEKSAIMHRRLYYALVFSSY